MLQKCISSVSEFSPLPFNELDFVLIHSKALLNSSVKHHIFAPRSKVVNATKLLLCFKFLVFEGCITPFYKELFKATNFL